MVRQASKARCRPAFLCSPQPEMRGTMQEERRFADSPRIRWWRQQRSSGTQHFFRRVRPSGIPWNWGCASKFCADNRSLARRAGSREDCPYTEANRTELGRQSACPFGQVALQWTRYFQSSRHECLRATKDEKRVAELPPSIPPRRGPPHGGKRPVFTPPSGGSRRGERSAIFRAVACRCRRGWRQRMANLVLGCRRARRGARSPCLCLALEAGPGPGIRTAPGCRPRLDREPATRETGADPEPQSGSRRRRPARPPRRSWPDDTAARRCRRRCSSLAHHRPARIRDAATPGRLAVPAASVGPGSPARLRGR